MAKGAQRGITSSGNGSREKVDPIIFDGEEYRIRRQEYNPGVGRIPHDFLRFDPTELETPLGELLHADDQWAYVHEKDGKPWELPNVKTELGRRIDLAICNHGLAGNQAALVR